MEFVWWGAEIGSVLLTFRTGKRKKDLQIMTKNSNVGPENQSVHPIHTNFIRSQVLCIFENLIQHWAMANRLRNYIMTCYSERVL
jgi:hypothetical protein